MEITVTGQRDNLAEIKGTPEITQAQIPSWFPDQLKGQIEQYKPEAWASLVDNFSRSLGKYGVDSLADEFNLPTWDKRADLSEKDRKKVLDTLGISPDKLSEYLRARSDAWVNNHDLEYLKRKDELKKEIATQILSVTSDSYERNRPRREKEVEEWQKIKDLGREDYARSLDKVFSLFAPSKQPPDKFLNRIYNIPAGVESRFREMEHMKKEN